MAPLAVHHFICRKDNYGVLTHAEDGTTVSIDAPDAATVQAELDAKGWRLTHILVTHHHGDHTAGIAELKERWNCVVVGPKAEAARIPGIDHAVEEGDRVNLGGHAIEVLDTPGHTLGHVTYHMPDDRVAFVGDTVFAMGCGRILEGNAEMMWHSLSKIAKLPAETRLYTGHEYSLANARFGLTIEPENPVLQDRARQAENLPATGGVAPPATVGLELQSNVFLRPHVFAVREKLGLRADADWRVFAELRERKNKF